MEYYQVCRIYYGKMVNHVIIVTVIQYSSNTINMQYGNSYGILIGIDNGLLALSLGFLVSSGERVSTSIFFIIYE